MALADWIEIGRMDELGRMDTPVHRVDARAKALVTLAFIAVVMSFSPGEISALMPFFLYPAVLLSAGRIPPRPILRKVLVAAPFALLVAIFNPLLDRQPAATWGPLVISGGWVSFASILLRFVLSVGAALILVACTGMHRLAAALEQLGIPRVFVVQLLFVYRYLFVVVDAGSRMHRGLELRSAGTRSLPLRTYGSLIGHLLLRSMDRAERVYRAMVSRGFDGRVRVATRQPFQWTDAAFVLVWIVFFAAARTWNLATELGALLTGVAG